MTFVEVITADGAERDTPLEELVAGRDAESLLAACAELDGFWRESDNLYERVRALFFLHSIHRFHLPDAGIPAVGRIPSEGWQHLLDRGFGEAIEVFQEALAANGPSAALSSALASAYRGLGFQTLADQVRRSVRSAEGNDWMFSVRKPTDQPLRIAAELRDATAARATLCERTPVRMDFSHAGWSDIFFLGMDHPEGAQVINASIDLCVHGRDAHPAPPIETYVRVIDEPVLRLISVDLHARADIHELDEVFDFARDYLGLLKAAVIASGLVPPGLEGHGGPIAPLLETLLGRSGGIEITSRVLDIPKGSRLAVSTNLLASLIAVAMRASGQTESLEGALSEGERRSVAARAILGEWLGGSGGGWQDSGGLWPGIKWIRGVHAREGDPEHGVSRGCLLPHHDVLGPDRAPPELLERLEASLVLVHGGMAQNVGPVLEMVTEKYLLRCATEWRARGNALELLQEIARALQGAEVQRLGQLTTRNFFEPIQTIIPWATNLFTETIVERVRSEFGSEFWGFWMLGGMSGGGMGFVFDPHAKPRALATLQPILQSAKDELRHALPFAMDPVLYDFSVNSTGSVGARVDAPPKDALENGAADTLESDGDSDAKASARHASALSALLERIGFDAIQHERIRSDLRSARIGLDHNRLPPETHIEDVQPDDVIHGSAADDASRELGRAALDEGRVCMLTLAAGTGSRWTQGAGVVKALFPLCRMGGQQRRFLEVQLEKTRRLGVPHIVTTSYLTHDPIVDYIGTLDAERRANVHVSRGRSVGVRFVPTARDLRFAWEHTPEQRLDEQAQKVRNSARAALIEWARGLGEAADYVQRDPQQSLHPVGHAYEVPNLMLNGVLRDLTSAHPNLRYILLHNIDTLGVSIDPGLLGLFIQSEAGLAFEVVPRFVDDHGGGLARVDGHLRLVESLALPREELARNLSYYNSMTTWIDIDRLLEFMQLSRDDLGDRERVRAAVRALTDRLPTYVTLKDVKERWGHGHEDILPILQYEKLWSDLTRLSGLKSAFFAVSRLRGQQLKEPEQLDGWARDGSQEYVARLCGW